jgi:phage-related protein
MPRLVTPALQAILNDAFVRASTLELHLSDGRVLYWATLPLVFEGREYQGGWLAKADGTEQAVSVAVDRATVRLHNADERFSLLIADARRLFEAATAIVGAAYCRKSDYDQKAALAQWVWQERFRGRVRLPSGDKSQAKVEIVSDREAAGLLASESYGEKCELTYKGPECGYAGALQTCDKTLKGPNGCERHGNSYRFPAAPGEPDTVAAPPGSGGDPGGGIGDGGPGDGGTCFPAGTRILLANGREKLIENIRTGDQVMCFSDDCCTVEPGAVVAAIEHQASEFIVFEGLHGEILRVTPEHLLLSSSGDFVAASEWVAPMELWWWCDDAWTLFPLKKVRKVSGPPEKVYNFHVTPHPTYFANCFAVHNLKRDDFPGGIVL